MSRGPCPLDPVLREVEKNGTAVIKTAHPERDRIALKRRRYRLGIPRDTNVKLSYLVMESPTKERNSNGDLLFHMTISKSIFTPKS